jgi:hypothetical protein
MLHPVSTRTEWHQMKAILNPDDTHAYVNIRPMSSHAWASVDSQRSCRSPFDEFLSRGSARTRRTHHVGTLVAVAAKWQYRVIAVHINSTQKNHAPIGARQQAFADQAAQVDMSNNTAATSSYSTQVRNHEGRDTFYWPELLSFLAPGSRSVTEPMSELQVRMCRAVHHSLAAIEHALLWYGTLIVHSPLVTPGAWRCRISCNSWKPSPLFPPKSSVW